MTRVARWFGLGGGASAQAPPLQSLTPRDQQQSAASHSSYAYPKPAQHFDAAGKPCGLCNKYPWVPMFGQQQQKQPQQPQQQQQQHAQQAARQPQQQLLLGWQQQPLAQASQQRQRAVQFPPSVSQGAAPQSVFLPISVPLPALSNVALPPIYNAQLFRPLIQPQSQSQSQSQSPAQTHQHAQSHYAPSPSLENVGAHSELRPVPLPTSRPASSGNFEIVKSHRLTDFVTSVEYPATFVQSHAIDLGQTSDVGTASTQLPSNHKTPLQQQQQQQQSQTEQLLPQDISTVRYQLEDLSSGSVHQHLPASQLLTELGNYETAGQTTLPPPADNYPAASSHQHQHQHQHHHQQQQQEQEHDSEQEQQHLYYAEQYLEQQLIETSTVTPQYLEPLLYTTTEQPMPAAVELNNHLAPLQQHHLRDGRQRETPKRLLDSPIQHAQGVAPPPRPFTRDPAELSVRHSQAPTKAPTPTSTYSAIDASGQFAGMSPPSPQQVIIPYTTKQKPRPFEPAQWTPGWGVVRPQENDVEELHEQQESKLVSSATAVPPAQPGPPQRTTKYLTKILASNLRELLKRERETKRGGRPDTPIGVDISKLQHNIDGWTEQEYNSLSHRPSTPTIRGRSKHIPSEYLTTTTPATPTATSVSASKLTRGGFELGGGGGGVGSATAAAAAGDLSTSINNLEQLHLQRFQPVDDNRLLPDYYETQHRQRYSTTPLLSSSSRSSTTTTTTSTTTTTTTPVPPTTIRDMVTPLYVRSTPAPMELWKQAKVAILPQTNEKVYVVTPQPRLQRHSSEPVAAASAQAPVYQTPAPRFPRVRPTPRLSTGESSWQPYLIRFQFLLHTFARCREIKFRCHTKSMQRFFALHSVLRFFSTFLHSWRANGCHAHSCHRTGA